MQPWTSRRVIALTILCIALQTAIWHAWNNGALNHFSAVYQSFGQSIPPALAFGLRSASTWWAAPLCNALLLAIFWRANNRSRWLFAPLACSVASVIIMMYIMYSEPLLAQPIFAF